MASERLGHAGVTLVTATYTRLLPELGAGMAAALQSVFRAARRAGVGPG